MVRNNLINYLELGSIPKRRTISNDILISMRIYCIECNNKLTEDNKVSGSKSRCKPCYAAYMKQYYKNNPDKYEKHKSIYVKNNDDIWTCKVDAFLSQRFSEGCLDCGEMDPIVLDLDHLDPSQKKYKISDLRKRKVSEQELIEELEKCEVVCANCHRIRTHNRLVQQAC